VVVGVAGTGVVADDDRRLPRWAVRFLVGAGVAGSAWLFAAFLGSGVASAAEAPTTASGAQGDVVSTAPASGNTTSGLVSADSSGSTDLLSGLLGTVTTTVSSLTGTVSSLTDGVVGGLTDTLDDTVGTVTQGLAPTAPDNAPDPTDTNTGTATDSGVGSGSGVQVQSTPAATTSTASTSTNTPAKTVVRANVPARNRSTTAQAAGHPVTRSVVHRTHSRTSPARPASSTVAPATRAAHRTPRKRVPDPAPQPTPDPVVPATSVTASHGDGGCARNALAVHPSGLFTGSPAALGIHSNHIVSWTARNQGLPATSPD
jgi:hypothetical protein